MYVQDFPKITSMYFYILVLFSPKHHILEELCLKKPPKSWKTDFGQKGIENLNEIHLWYEFEIFLMIKQLKIILSKNISFKNDTFLWST